MNDNINTTRAGITATLGQSTLILLTATLAAPAMAEPPPVINVTASRMARTADQTLASVTVIDRAEIERSQAMDLAHLLDGRAGVSMNVAGGYGQPTSLFLRGTNSNQLLVLVDGVRFGSASLGSTPWQDLPLSQIERIEIVRGPRSHLYGPDAIGGVVQIFTRQGGGEGVRLDADAGYGRYHTFKGNSGISGGDRNTRFSLRGGYIRSDGFDATEGGNKDDDGYRNTSFSGSISHRFDTAGTLQLNALHEQGNTEYDGFSATDEYDADFEQSVFGGRYRFTPLAWWDTSLSAGYSRDEQKNHVNDVKSSVFKTTRKQAGWQNDFTIGSETTLTLGADFLRDQVSGTTDYSRDKRDTRGIYAQYQSGFGPLDLSAGLRHDNIQHFGNHTTGDLALGYNFAFPLRVYASYGTAYKAPTFNDLYYQDPWGSSGNPDLDAEKSKSWELGLSGSPAWGTWRVNLYRTDIDDLIQWLEVAPFTWQPRNVSRARIDGAELALDTTIAGWRIAGELTLMDPRDRNSDNQLPGRPKQNLRLDLDRRFGALGIGATLQSRSHSYSDADNKVKADGYTLLDLRTSYRLSPAWVIRGRLGNLFDKNYQTVAGYNSPGRDLFVSIAYQQP
ncbi:MAG TPA: TonB-dependent receptor [Sedimenticola sp.]|nr:TonB-dependent receptor [Sedimenticola sp.]